MNQSEAAAARADNLYIRFSVRRIKPQQLLLREKWQARATNLMMETKAGEGKKNEKQKKKESRCMNIDEESERGRWGESRWEKAQEMMPIDRVTPDP